MQLITDTTQFHLTSDTAVAIGKFDGIHLGHRKLLGSLVEMKQQGLLACVFTFDPSPEKFFGGSSVQELMTREEKRRAFEKLGVDILIEYPFNKESASVDPELFIRDTLVKQMRAKVIIAGSDLSFGDRGAGNFELLDSLADKYGYRTRMIRKEQYQGKDISSTLIRDYVRQGKMEDAAACLGSPYMVEGIVTRGNAIGRTIGFPTLNLYPPQEKLLPPFGVYYSRVTFREKSGEVKHCEGMTDIGMKPTVHEKIKRISVETFVYDFHEDLYGTFIRLELLTFRRPEIRFPNFGALQHQISIDVTAGRDYFGLKITGHGKEQQTKTKERTEDRK